MAVGRSHRGPAEGERASDGLRCAYAGMPVSSFRGTPVSDRRADQPYPPRPNPEEQLAMTTVENRQDFKVADLSLAAFGRKEITPPSTRCRA